MSDVVDKLLRLSSKELRRWSSKRKGRGKYERRERPKRSKEQLAEYLKKNKFKTRDQLRAGRREGDPTDVDYCAAYGSWRAASREIFDIKPLDREYVIKAIIEFGLWSRDSYKEARRKRPDVFPSLYAVLREFGEWGILREVASAMSLRKTLQAYMELKRRIGKRPTREECRMAGVIIDEAIKMYGSKSAFDKFVESMEKMS